MEHLPKWADVVLIPVLSLLTAFLISGGGDLGNWRRSD